VTTLIAFRHNSDEVKRDLSAMMGAFKTLPPVIAKRYLRSGMSRAIKPFVPALKSATPKGPTGNLRRSVKAITKFYDKSASGAAVGIVGFGKGGKKKNQKGGHSTLVENGTGQRVQKKTKRKCGRMPARGMLAATLSSNGQAILGAICAQMADALERAAAKAAK